MKFTFIHLLSSYLSRAGRGIHGDGGRLRCWMALNSWVDAASGEVSLRAVVRQLLQLLQRRSAAAVVGAWAGAADDLRRRRKLAQRSQCRILSAAWNWWANGVASSAAEAKVTNFLPCQLRAPLYGATITSAAACSCRDR